MSRVFNAQEVVDGVGFSVARVFGGAQYLLGAEVSEFDPLYTAFMRSHCQHHVAER